MRVSVDSGAYVLFLRCVLEQFHRKSGRVGRVLPGEIADGANAHGEHDLSLCFIHFLSLLGTHDIGHPRAMQGMQDVLRPGADKTISKDPCRIT